MNRNLALAALVIFWWWRRQQIAPPALPNGTPAPGSTIIPADSTPADSTPPFMDSVSVAGMDGGGVDLSPWSQE